MTPMTVRLGTRASPLARWQADWVAAELHKHNVPVELVLIRTHGDQELKPVEEIGGQGLFTREIQRALLDGRIDLAVHSLKDLPTDEVPGLCLAAVPERAAAGDALVSAEGAALAQLPAEAVIGTGSLRRRAQLLSARSDLRMQDIRGNVDTRLRKLRQGDYHAIVLAEAGLRRLGLQQEITEILSLRLMLPAVGQGALALETRLDDAAARETLAALDHAPSHQAVLAERAMLAALMGGCLAPIAGYACIEDERLLLRGRVLGPDGAQRLEATQSAPPEQAVELGERVAAELLAQGAAELIRASRETEGKRGQH